MKMRYEKTRSGRRILQCVLLLALFTVFGLAGCASQKVIVPPVSNSAAFLRLPGKFVWFDLYTTDMTSASNFYDALFDWDFERTNDTNPRIKTVFHRGKAIGNMIGRESEPGNSQWLSYMSVEDVDSSVVAAENMGATLHIPAKELPNRGRIAVILDPQKAGVALLTSSTGDPVDDKYVINRWLGCELWTTDVDGAGLFYKKLVGYDVELKDMKGKGKYSLLTRRGKRRGGIAKIPWDDVKPEWIPYIAVENVLATTMKAQTVGGTVILAPDMSIKEGRVAIIADPSGAVFGIQQLN